MQPMDLSHPCTFQLEVAPPPIHTSLSEWAIIAPLISICYVLLMRGRPIDTLQKRKKEGKRGKGGDNTTTGRKFIF